MAVALAFVVLSGCVRDEPPKRSTTSPPRNKAVARCAGQECRVRVTCKGRVSVRLGAAPVRVRTSNTALRTAIFLDFAGSRDDVVIRC